MNIGKSSRWPQLWPKSEIHSGSANKIRWAAKLPILLLMVAICVQPLQAMDRQSTNPAQPHPSLKPVSPEQLPGVPIDITSTPLDKSSEPCTDVFDTHDLDHITTAPGDKVELFEANGAGVAIGDLDSDGDLDIVLANHAGFNAILWNEGDLVFRKEPMPEGDSRAVNLVDVDGDGLLDMVLTRRTGAINFWRNTGQVENRFVRRILPGIARPAYAINWGDLDGDGDLDLVTGSYDAGLLVDLGNSFLMGGGGGVYYYEHRDGRFVPQNLAGSAQAMAIVFFDIDEDGRQDIVVGNDFAVPDYAWLNTGAGWTATSFDTTSHSTMSLDVGDVDNDGHPELFATDMMPYAEDPDTVAAWEPIMADMPEEPTPGDPQIMSNMLQVQTGVVGYQNAASARGVDVTGWSWSAKFGDLDRDGWLDLYVVNGMIEVTSLAHLPQHELVEENQVLRNIGDGYFRPALDWKMGSTSSGRGMSMADLDGDGDLDIVINNLRAPAQLLENRLCGGAALEVDLYWPGSGNSRAIGALVVLHTDAGTLYRDVRVASGYLSGDPSRLHFGFPEETHLESLEIRWPDGAISVIEAPQPQTLLAVTRNGDASDLPGPQPTAGSLPALASTDVALGKTGSRKCAACGAALSVRSTAENDQMEPLDDQLRAIIAAQGLTGDPSQGRALPSIEDPLAQLGKKLFFTKALGGDKDTACVSCHHPLLAGGDGLSVSIGVGARDPDLLGPGRMRPDGRSNVARNASTTFNIGLWDAVLFFDGRIESLGKTPGKNGNDGLGIRTPDSLYGASDPEAGADLVAAQSRFPLTSRDEMRGVHFEAHKPNRYVRAHLSERLGDYDPGAGELAKASWLAEFRQALNGQADAETLISDENVSAALAAYQRSQVFVDTPWRAYVQGDQDAISASAKRGALLFFRPPAGNGADCARCHSGDFFTDEQFHVLAIPQVGPGKDDGRFHDDDFGRFRETGQPADLYAFRTPTLLNVEVTGPYGHDGAYTTLEGVVRHHLDPAAALRSYDYSELDPSVQTEHTELNTNRALAKLEADRRAGLPTIENVMLSDAQVADLISFLLSLTDPCVRDPACLARWIPDQRDADPDGLRLNAKIPSLKGSTAS